MARDVNDIVVIGFGSWSDVNALPTLGFKISPVTHPDSGILQYRGNESLMEYRGAEERLHYRSAEK